MAYKTSISLRLNAVTDTGGRFHARKGYGYKIVQQPVDGCFNVCSLNSELFLMAFSTIIHFHPVPAVLLETGNVFSPDVPAVAGNPALFIDPGSFGLADMIVAGNAIHLCTFDVGGMGKEYAVRLL